MRYDRPSPVPEEPQMGRPELRPVLLQSVDRPHRHVGDDQERYQLPSRLLLRLLGVPAPPEPAIQNEHGLNAGLDEGEDFREQTCWGVLRSCEVTADYREHAVDEHPSLGHHEERVV